MDTRTKMIMFMNEGKVWDATKKLWRDHKGKIIGGLAVAGAVGVAAYANRDKGKTNVKPNDPLQKSVDNKKDLFTKRNEKMKAKSAAIKAKCGNGNGHIIRGKITCL